MFKRLFLTRNLATWDRLFRLLPAIVAAWAWQQGLIAGPLAITLAVLSGALVVTGLTGTCSIYGMLGLSTRKS